MNGTLAPLNWETEVKKYDLIEITPGVVVMKRNANGRGPMSMNEPDHYLCPDCFGQMRKSFLQHDPNSLYRACGPCRREYFWGIPRQEGAAEGRPAAKDVKNQSLPAIMALAALLKDPPLPPKGGYPSNEMGALAALVMTRAIAENLSRELHGAGASGSTIEAIDDLIIRKIGGAK